MDRKQFEEHVRSDIIPTLESVSAVKSGPYSWGDTAWANLQRIAEFSGLTIPQVTVVLIAKHLGVLGSPGCTAADCDGPKSRIVDCLVYLSLLHGYFTEAGNERA